MSEDILQIEYDSMEKIAGAFFDQADVIEMMIQNLRFYLLNVLSLKYRRELVWNCGR